MNHPDPGEWLRTNRAPEGLLEGAMRRQVAPRASAGAVAGRIGLAAALVLLGVGVGWAARGLHSQNAQDLPQASVMIAAGSAQKAAETLIPVRLVLYAPEARSVTVAGTFNGWDRATSPLVRGPQGTWHGVLLLPKGRHEYMFVLNGTTWIADPAAPLTQPDEFGNQNGVLHI